MSKRNSIAAAAFCAFLVGAPPILQAATVSKQAGSVLVSKGEGFEAMTSSADLAPGSRIMVQPGGLATITYSSTCSVRVGSGVWFVQAAPPCSAGTTVIDFTNRMNQQGPPDQADNTLVVGGLIVAGGVGLAILLSNDKKSSP